MKSNMLKKIAELVKTIETTVNEKEYRIEIFYSKTELLPYSSRIYIHDEIINIILKNENQINNIPVWQEIRHLAFKVPSASIEESDKSSLDLLDELN